MRSALLLALLALAACGGSDHDADATVVASSNDGVVTATATRDPGVDITITPVTDLEGPLADAADAGLRVFSYDLGPDGQRFDEPVTIEFRLPRADLGLEAGTIPLAILVGGDGATFAGYEEIDIDLDGDDVLISGATTHFSSISAVVGGGWVTMAPFGFDGVVGQQVAVGVTAEDLEGDAFGAVRKESLDYTWFAAAPWLSVVGVDSGTISPPDSSASSVIRCDQETPAASLVFYGVDVTLNIVTPVRGIVGEMFAMTSVKRIRTRLDAVAVCTIGLATTTSTSTTTTTTEPEPPTEPISFPDDTNDLVAVGGFEADPNPPPESDIVGLIASTNADETIITICFAGPAQELVGREDGVFVMDILITPQETPLRILNILYNDDGTSKVSDPPPGVSVSHEWVSPDKLRFTLRGWTLEEGTEVEVLPLVGQGSFPTVYSQDVAGFTWPG